jgi:2-polyprenyl-6-methoxyphenol hydroxylase-like FAD-dependent oxidoreductase
MMAGYLMARLGVKTLVLEKHADFLRDFRGDTVHPSTLQAMADLGLLDAFLQLPHSKLHSVGAEVDGEVLRVINFDRLPVECRFIAFMPQWDFLDFLKREGRKLPQFDVRMQAEAVDLVRDSSHRIVGLRAQTPGGALEVRADLVIGADGRHSVLRDRAGLKVEDLGAPMDVFWFRLSRDSKDQDQLLARVNRGHFIITIDRGDYWQCAYLIPKGGADAVYARGIEAFRHNIAEAAPFLAARTAELETFDDVKLLSVAVDRLTRWSLPGLLFIGDAAHTMSPIGGVGINLAVQDAIAAANLLGDRLAAGERLDDHDLDAVRRRRLLPTRMIQQFQVLAQNRVLKPALGDQGVSHINATPIRIIAHAPLLQRLAARMLGLGVRLERVKTQRMPPPAS